MLAKRFEFSIINVLSPLQSAGLLGLVFPSPLSVVSASNKMDAGEMTHPVFPLKCGVSAQRDGAVFMTGTQMGELNLILNYRVYHGCSQTCLSLMEKAKRV